MITVIGGIVPRSVSSLTFGGALIFAAARVLAFGATAGAPQTGLGVFQPGQLFNATIEWPDP